MEANITSNLEAYYKFNTNGTMLVDSVNNRTATIVAGTNWSTSGKMSGGCISFTGGTNRFDSAVMEETDNATLCLWMKPTLGSAANQWVAGGHQVVLSQQRFNTNGNLFMNFYDWYAQANFERYGYSAQYVVTDWNYIPGGVWTHYALSYDKLNNTVKVYINGILVQTIVTPLDTLSSSAWSLGNWATASRPYKGLVDEFRIYSRTLSADDILNVYQYTGETSNPGPTIFRIQNNIRVPYTSITVGGNITRKFGIINISNMNEKTSNKFKTEYEDN